MVNRLWLFALSAVTLSACGSAVSSSSTAASPAYVTPSTAANNHVIPSISTINTKYGKVLGTESGYAYYVFELDSPTTSNCNASCAAVWPPVIGYSHVISGSVKKSLVGTITIPGGSTQLTYAGHPLYTYEGDRSPGDTAGQGVDSFGSFWYLIAPNGKVIASSASTSSSVAGS